MKISLKDMAVHETILLYGKGKCGKTFAVCSAMEKCFESGGKVYYVNTDNGLKRTFYTYFGDNADKYIPQLEYYFVESINAIPDIVKDIKANVTANDLIVIDLLSSMWELAQQKFIESASGGDFVGYIEKASRDKSKFGMLDSQKWQYIKKLDNIIIQELVIRPLCKVIAICSARSIEHDKLHDNKSVVDRYLSVKHKPGGQPELIYYFNTIIFIGESKNDKQYFITLGDRGQSKPIFTRVSYGRNFWDAFMKYRNVK